MGRRFTIVAMLATLGAGGVGAQEHGQGAHGGAGHGHPRHGRHAASDTGFAALQQRGKVAMGVDQYTSRHRFEPLPDGGRIELVRDEADSAGVATIRAHLSGIAESFARGDFRTPAFVHQQEVPGTRVMAERREKIRYHYRPLPGGGEVRIVTTDSLAVDAVHRFLEFQRRDHRAH
ncbi:MAG TPA: hypothetical protein VNK43_08850 [Gemmatimonadales bacterium]|nr:hypothetical protein [Gemmatimonadales bacterium]